MFTVSLLSAKIVETFYYNKFYYSYKVKIIHNNFVNSILNTMKLSEQTESVKVRLYNLTSLFTKKYVWRYYKQFKGDINDLISQYYIEFLTPKSREKGKEESLLDKFDPSVTTLEYLVKVAVQRKLIDSSRQNPFNNLSFDKLHDEYGDCITEAFELVDDPEEEVGFLEDKKYFTKGELGVLKLKFENLTDSAKEEFIKQFNDVKCALSESYQDLFKFVISGYENDKEFEKQEVKSVLSEVYINGYGLCPVQQLTSKTLCVFVPSESLVLDFNRFTGEARKKQYVEKYSLPSSELLKLEKIELYHSGISRVEFEQKQRDVYLLSVSLS